LDVLVFQWSWILVLKTVLDFGFSNGFWIFNGILDFQRPVLDLWFLNRLLDQSLTVDGFSVFQDKASLEVQRNRIRVKVHRI